jgi:hypothetical protein
MVGFLPYPMNVDLKEFIADGARRITPAHLDKLVRWLPEIRLGMILMPQPEDKDALGP